MEEQFLPLEEQFNLDSLKQPPHQLKATHLLAIPRDERALAEEYQKLQAENEVLKAKLLAITNELKEKERRLQVEKANLRRENQRLLNLAKTLYALTFVFFLILFFT
ncbi:MAG: hypothetical protein AB4368_24865 [Xenococcaceae cyanobacterium]